MDRLKGKVSIVTGANSGIGKRTAEIFADEGSDLVLVARRLDKLKEVEAECAAKGVKVISVSADVSIYEDCQKVVKEAIDAFGKIDVLVNNAGIAGHTGDGAQDPTTLDLDVLRTVLDTNVFGVVRVTNAMLPLLRRSDAPRIVMVSSGLGSLTITADPSRIESQILSLTYPPALPGWFNLGVIYARTGPMDAALSQGAFARAFQLDPALRDRTRELTIDASTYRTGLDLSRPLPARWSSSVSTMPSSTAMPSP